MAGNESTQEPLISEARIEELLQSTIPSTNANDDVTPMAISDEIIGDGVQQPIDHGIDTAVITEPESLMQEFMIQCRNLLGDVKISDEVVEEAIQNDEKGILEVELESLKEYEQQYRSLHCKLIQLAENKRTEPKPLEDDKRKFLFFVKKLKGKIVSALKPPTTQSRNSIASRLKIAKIDIPTFKGDREAWNAFKRVYTTYIHENNDLTICEKYQILVSKVQEEAATFIEDIPLEDAYYADAWEILVGHYDDPLKRVSRFIDGLSAFAGGKDLRRIVTYFRANVTSLKIVFSQNPSIDVMSQFCIHLFLQKTTQATRLDWEREVEKTKEFPKFDQFIKFMDGRCNAFERATGSVPTNTVTKGKVLLGASSSSHSQSSRGRCFYCNDSDHFLHRCQKFLKLSTIDRNSFVRKKRLCPKCFKSIHKCNNKCNFNCKTCRRAHNTLIHVDHFVPSQSTKNQTSMTANDSKASTASNISSSNRAVSTDVGNRSDPNNQAKGNSGESIEKLLTERENFQCGWVLVYLV